MFEYSGKLNGVHRLAQDQWLKAAQSIPLHIAEGNGKTAEADYTDGNTGWKWFAVDGTA